MEFSARMELSGGNLSGEVEMFYLEITFRGGFFCEERNFS